MPYRRLPNTVQARIRALKAVVERGDAGYGEDLAVSFRTLAGARAFLPKFEAARNYYAVCYDRQAKAGHKHQERVRMARLYLSHFIQVLNFSVIRAEIRLQQKGLYGLPVSSHTVPDLSAESALLSWGRKVIEGENKRVAQGGIPIYNPTIAKVRVHYDLFVESYEQQKNLQNLTARSLEALSAMRAEADALILDIWNQVEKKFETVVPLGRRLNLCRAHGLIYYYRKGEKNVEEENV